MFAKTIEGQLYCLGGVNFAMSQAGRRHGAEGAALMAREAEKGLRADGLHDAADVVRQWADDLEATASCDSAPPHGFGGAS